MKKRLVIDHLFHSPDLHHRRSRQSRQNSPPGRHRRETWRCTDHCRTGARPGGTPAHWCSGWAGPSWALNEEYFTKQPGSRKRCKLTWELIAVVDLCFPIAGLSKNVESEARGTSNCGKTNGSGRPSSIASVMMLIILLLCWWWAAQLRLMWCSKLYSFRLGNLLTIKLPFVWWL